MSYCHGNGLPQSARRAGMYRWLGHGTSIIRPSLWPGGRGSTPHAPLCSPSPPSHQFYTFFTPAYTSFTPVLHLLHTLHTSSTPFSFQPCTSFTPALHILHTSPTPHSHQSYASFTPVCRNTNLLQQKISTFTKYTSFIHTLLPPSLPKPLKYMHCRTAHSTKSNGL